MVLRYGQPSMRTRVRWIDDTGFLTCTADRAMPVWIAASGVFGKPWWMRPEKCDQNIMQLNTLKVAVLYSTG